MQRREFITAAVGFAQDYPDLGAIKKMPVGEGAAGAAKFGWLRQVSGNKFPNQMMPFRMQYPSAIRMLLLQNRRSSFGIVS